MYRITYLIIIISLFTSCDEKDGQEIDFTTIEKKKIQLNFAMREMISTTQCKNIEGTDYLFRFIDYQSQQKPQALEIINLTSERVEKIINFPMEGPNAFDGLVNFHVHNFDSIFFHNEAFPLTFYLTDTSKVIKQKWEIEDMEIGAGWSANSAPFLIDDRLYFHSFSTQSFYPDEQDFIENEFLSYLHLRTGAITPISSVDFPKIFKENFRNGKWFPWSESPILHHYNNKMFVGFMMSPEVTSIKEGQTEKIKLEISQSKLAVPVSIDINDYASNFYSLIGNSQLSKIIYDPYRKKLIRLFKRSIEIGENEDRESVYYRSKFDLLFFDLNGKLVATLELPKNKINPSVIIPTEKGLLINTDNPFNPENHEDYLEFNHISIDNLQ
ncbi:DUF4221 family protein [Marivirga harenae]|uniref:DUF4221 family protein n=1 Tax=Marivirga harenae TaxID=2010992 RepID=UPI0026DF4859|nr:DUF4221 family protein [Marivirga harenae]WKV11000.1 DUF4221 family protein [Marivirga harenae]|tara:strand:- start:71182 stop:72333 length:1152 start_codon:yes stop_codon:yes gene_type:complete